MESLQILVRPTATATLEPFVRAVTEKLGPALLDLKPGRLTLTFTAETPPRLSLIPFRRKACALVSLAGDGLATPGRWVEAARAALPGARVSAYRVTEARPVEYARDWPDGADTPGVGLLTLFRKPARLDSEQFLRRWHGHHTPLSLKIHPLWNYVRCAVEAPVVAGSEAWDGIVEEHFRSGPDLLDPVRFFGGPLWMIPNMVRVGLDVTGFIDLPSIQTYLVRERHLRS